MANPVQNGGGTALTLAAPGQVLCRFDAIADPGGKGFVFGAGVERREIFVIRRGAEIFAYVNSCPHIGTTLDWRPDQFLTSDKCFILCGTHGAIFDIANGLCLKGPCAGKSLTPVAVALEGASVVLRTELD